jgi:DNA polymerase-3 subunit delta'
MASRKDDDESGIAAPRETAELFGHTEAERTLLGAYRSGRIAHAWLIGGARGIGKATLAYRMARFVLANPVPALPAVTKATSLAIDPNNPVARQVASGAHGGLLTLERTANDKGVLRSEIVVGQSRDTLSFFGTTAAVDGWRICVVDTVDELNENAANALLKIIEEPPARSLFLLISHAPQRVLATIRSRCRKLSLRPLEDGDVIRAAALATGKSESDPELIAAAAASGGSAGHALELMGGKTLGLQKQTEALLDGLPKLDPRALHTLGDQLPLNDRAALGAVIDSIERWISEKLHHDDVSANLPRLARLAEVWEKIVNDARETEAYNLERKPLVFSVFGMLAEATR